MPNFEIPEISLHEVSAKDTRTNEERSQTEMSETLKSFKLQSQNETQVFNDNTESEYWVCLCFQSRAQVEEFLTKTGWGQPTDKYIDGLDVSQKINITIESPTPPRHPYKIDRTWVEWPTI